MYQNKIVCEVQIKEKKLKERYRNKYTEISVYYHWRIDKLDLYEYERLPNEKDGYHRHEIKTMQEKKRTLIDEIIISELGLNVKYRKSRAKKLPDSHDDIKSFAKHKSWKTNSKRKKQWF